MVTAIIDLCIFSAEGIKNTLIEQGVKAENIKTIQKAADLIKYFELCHPSVVFINDNFYTNDIEHLELIKGIISRHFNTIFIVLTALCRKSILPHLMIRHNLIINSYHAPVWDTVNISNHAKNLNFHIVNHTLTTKERFVFKAWMSGESAKNIQNRLNIRERTLTSYKNRIRKKLYTSNTQLLYQIAHFI